MVVSGDLAHLLALSVIKVSALAPFRGIRANGKGVGADFYRAAVAR